MSSITVKVKDLYETAKLMHVEGLDYVEVTLLDPEITPDGQSLPAGINFNAWAKNESFMNIDFGCVDAVKDE